jgi:RNA-binding protein 23/39
VCLSQGFVYVKFATITAAEAAQKALHGRWFAGKQICAEFQLQAMYRQHFGE